MGYGEFGGNGSVDWKIDVDDKAKPGKKRASAYGRDDKDATRFRFTIDFDSLSSAQKAWESIQAAISALNPNDKRLVFEIPVENNNSDQIKIDW